MEKQQKAKGGICAGAFLFASPDVARVSTERHNRINYGTSWIKLWRHRHVSAQLKCSRTLLIPFNLTKESSQSATEYITSPR